jgi:hypothetical protein
MLEKILLELRLLKEAMIIMLAALDAAFLTGPCKVLQKTLLLTQNMLVTFVKSIRRMYMSKIVIPIEKKLSYNTASLKKKYRKSNK